MLEQIYSFVDMKVNIVRIGNSNGIILPKAIMSRYSLKRDDVLIVDDTQPVLTFRKEEDIKYEGPNTGFFKALSYHSGDDGTWGGVMDSKTYLESLRKGEPEKDITEW